MGVLVDGTEDVREVAAEIAAAVDLEFFAVEIEVFGVKLQVFDAVVGFGVGEDRGGENARAQGTAAELARGGCFVGDFGHNVGRRRRWGFNGRVGADYRGAHGVLLLNDGRGRLPRRWLARGFALGHHTVEDGTGDPCPHHLQVGQCAVDRFAVFALFDHHHHAVALAGDQKGFDAAGHRAGVEDDHVVVHA